MATQAPITGAPTRAPFSYPSRPTCPRVTRTPAQELAFARDNIEWASRQCRRAGRPELQAALLAIVERIAGLDMPAVHPLGCERCQGEVPTDLAPYQRMRLCLPCIGNKKAARRARRADTRRCLAIVEARHG